MNMITIKWACGISFIVVLLLIATRGLLHLRLEPVHRRALRVVQHGSEAPFHYLNKTMTETKPANDNQ